MNHQVKLIDLMSHQVKTIRSHEPSSENIKCKLIDLMNHQVQTNRSHEPPCEN